MFEGEKTAVFWVGLLILGMSSMTLFWMIWYSVLAMFSSTGLNFSWQGWIPPIVGTIVFILIGLYMMKSGVLEPKKDEPNTKSIQSAT
jgi:hypothetical protein